MSALRDSMIADFLKVDELEPVTVKRLSESSVVLQSIAVPFALRRAATKDVIEDVTLGRRASGQKLTVTSEVWIWHIPADTIAALVPRIGKTDAVVDADGVVYSVYKAELQTFRTRWRLTCVKE